jgi:hypothetical protein
MIAKMLSSLPKYSGGVAEWRRGQRPHLTICHNTRNNIRFIRFLSRRLSQDCFAFSKPLRFFQMAARGRRVAQLRNNPAGWLAPALLAALVALGARML